MTIISSDSFLVLSVKFSHHWWNIEMIYGLTLFMCSPIERVYRMDMASKPQVRDQTMAGLNAYDIIWC